MTVGRLRALLSAFPSSANVIVSDSRLRLSGIEQVNEAIVMDQMTAIIKPYGRGAIGAKVDNATHPEVMEAEHA